MITHRLRAEYAKLCEYEKRTKLFIADEQERLRILKDIETCKDYVRQQISAAEYGDANALKTILPDDGLPDIRQP